MVTSNNVFSEVVKIEEKLSDSDSFQHDLGLNFSHDFLDGEESVWYFFINIELFSDRVSVNVFDNISVGIELSFVGNDTFYDVGLDFFDILNISNKLSVSDLLGVGASGIFPAQNINKHLISHQVQVVQNSHKLLSGNKTALCSVVVL